MAPSNRGAAASSSRGGAKRRQLGAGAKKLLASTAASQSSILSFLIPRVKKVDGPSEAPPSAAGRAKMPADSAQIEAVVILDDDDEAAGEMESAEGVTDVNWDSTAAVSDSRPTTAFSPPEQQPQPPPPPPSSPSPPGPLSVRQLAAAPAAVRQASLLSFFTSSKAETPLDKRPSKQQQPPPPACGTWPSASGRTACPPVKWIDGTDLTVDAFNYGAQARCRGYFLSHFHYDHYCGLGRKFDGQLLASVQTVELVRLRLGVRPVHLRPLELQTWHSVPGAEVLLLDANHCPGSVVFLFRLRSTGRQILHTGDFRASPDLLDSVRGWLGANPEIDSLYLDTTYCSPQYDFPSQSAIIDSVLRLVTEFVAENANYLIACGSYTLGKERMYLSIARLLGCRAAVDSAKLRLLNSLADERISSLVARDDGRSRLQVLPLHTVTHAGLRRYLDAWRRRPDRPRVDACLGISPTGWSLSAKGVEIAPGLKRIYAGSGGGGVSQPTIAVYAAAYSEHSSFSELRDFVRGIRPRRILPTVNWHKRDACRLMQAHFDSWLRS